MQHTMQRQCHINHVRNSRHRPMKADTLSESHRAKLQKNTEQEMFYLDFSFVPFLQYPQGHSQNIKQDHTNLQADP